MPATKACRNALPKLSWLGDVYDSSFPIHVDEDAQTVTVDGGVQTRVLLDYLATHITAKGPMGWTLPSFSWYIDQTVAGAVATATHGSSMKYGSISGQVLELEVALANGTLATFAPASNPHLFAAVQVSVGRLGIITQVKLPIKAQKAVKRSLDTMSMDVFTQQLVQVEQNYMAALQSGDEAAVFKALEPVEAVQAFVFPVSGDLWKVSYELVATTSLDSTSELAGVVNTEKYYQSLTTDGTTSGPPKTPGAFAQTAAAPQGGSIYIHIFNATGWDLLGKALLYPLVAPGVYSARKSYLTQADLSSAFMADLDPYDQYEVSVTMDKAGTCFAGAVKLWKSGASEGMRVPGLIRFVSEETPYLSNSHGGARMFVNLEDHVSHTLKKPNLEFEKVVRYFIEECDARLHWGKAGWPYLEPCFDGAAHYAKWCDFGCAVEELDPSGKFRTESNAWSWRATQNGVDVPLQQCCTPTGFSSQCTCAPRTDRTGCPAPGTVLHINAD
ncbi:g8810 [Coccomyxa elongata]